MRHSYKNELPTTYQHPIGWLLMHGRPSNSHDNTIAMKSENKNRIALFHAMYKSKKNKKEKNYYLFIIIILFIFIFIFLDLYIAWNSAMRVLFFDFVAMVLSWLCY